MPFLLDEAFLLYMKNNCITINFWEKYEEEEIAIGTSQLSLHQFFIAYRNKAIADTLLQNRVSLDFNTVKYSFHVTVKCLQINYNFCYKQIWCCY